MQTLTIVRADNIVYIDRKAVRVDCSSLDPTIHAIQWNEALGQGSIEFAHAADDSKEPNQSIESIAEYQTLVDAALAYGMVKENFDLGPQISEILKGV